MKELKDIVLKKGDIIYLDGEGLSIESFGIGISPKKFRDGIHSKSKITKIERPVKYETIYEAPKQILDKEEKEYLENVIRPFRDRVDYILKFEDYNCMEFIIISIKNDGDIGLPCFKKGTMYKGMKLGKEYTLKELGLFE